MNTRRTRARAETEKGRVSANPRQTVTPARTGTPTEPFCSFLVHFGLTMATEDVAVEIVFSPPTRHHKQRCNFRPSVLSPP